MERVRCGELKKGLFDLGSGDEKMEVKTSIFPSTLNYTYSRTALYQELDELCRLVEKFRYRGLL